MKTEDFERLKKLCDENGFGIFRNGGNVIVSKKKDELERVDVRNWSYRTEEKDGKIYHECVFIAPIKEFSDDVHIFLAEQLEKYLNGEIE